jgi:hypothetical protein
MIFEIHDIVFESISSIFYNVIHKKIFEMQIE